MPDQLLARLRVLALGEARELVFAHLPMKPVTLRQLALPLAAHTFALGVVVLLGIGELFLVVRLRLTRADRLRHRDHFFFFAVYSKKCACPWLGEGGLSSIGCSDGLGSTTGGGMSAGPSALGFRATNFSCCRGSSK